MVQSYQSIHSAFAPDDNSVLLCFGPGFSRTCRSEGDRGRIFVRATQTEVGSDSQCDLGFELFIPERIGTQYSQLFSQTSACLLCSLSVSLSLSLSTKVQRNLCNMQWLCSGIYSLPCVQKQRVQLSVLRSSVLVLHNQPRGCLNHFG